MLEYWVTLLGNYEKNMAFENIELIKNTYYASMHVPPDVRDILGKSRFRKTLKTGDKRVAVQRARRIIAEWWDEIAIARAKTRLKLDDVTREALDWKKDIESTKTDLERETFESVLDDQIEDLVKRFGEAKAIEYHRIATGKATPIAPLIAEWETYIQKRINSKTVSLYVSDVIRFSREFNTFEKITKRGIREWLWDLKAPNGEYITDSTQSRILNGLSNFWKWCQSIKYCVAEDATNPFFNIPLSKAVSTRKILPYKPLELMQIANKAKDKGDSELYKLIMFASYTGARIEELCSVKVEHVMDNCSYFKILDSKTPASTRDVPIHSKFKSLIRDMCANPDDCGYLIKSTAENQHASRSAPLGKRFGRLKTSMGYTNSHNFHSIRHTLTTLLENAGIPENISSDIVGHEKKTMTYGLYSGGTSMKLKKQAIEKIRYPTTQDDFLKKS
jgi:integrase